MRARLGERAESVHKERASGREGERARNAWEPVKGWPLGVSVEGPYDDARFTDAAARCPLLEAVVQALRDACRHASEITYLKLLHNALRQA